MTITSCSAFSSGSESCSSVGSSSSSLSRPQLPLPVSAASWSSIPSAPLIHPAADTRGPAPPEMIKSVPSQLPSAADATNYFVLPLEASGMPPGSVLVGPHAGGGFGREFSIFPLISGFLMNFHDLWTEFRVGTGLHSVCLSN